MVSGISMDMCRCSQPAGLDVETVSIGHVHVLFRELFSTILPALSAETICRIIFHEYQFICMNNPVIHFYLLPTPIAVGVIWLDAPHH